MKMILGDDFMQLLSNHLTDTALLFYESQPGTTLRQTSSKSHYTRGQLFFQCDSFVESDSDELCVCPAETVIPTEHALCEVAQPCELAKAQHTLGGALKRGE